MESIPSSRTYTGTITAINQTVEMPVARIDNGWNVQVVGTFVGILQTELSINGTDFVAVAYRQASVGTVGSKITMPGIFRGNCGGAAVARVRAISWTSGTASVAIKAGGVAASLNNTFLEVRELAQYYAAAAGGRRAFNTTSGAITLSALGTVLVLLNPANSPIDCYIERITISNSANGIWTRLRNSTITPTGANQPEQNRGGGASSPFTKPYLTANATVSGGVATSTTHVGANFPFSLEENGSIILMPGQSIVWQFNPNSGAGTASVNCVWWENISD